ncbi:hypothetical protein PRZ48_005424 [Zasmidium cellare]|uniref:Uncharacterized protein n=1 Tax=Zasmidium cellare TaxID=395010 RepID=A0ABR0ETV5_ZASCE|nr:hypothetical protein PRZ48_005424 [Zasmidium cellare]
MKLTHILALLPITLAYALPAGESSNRKISLTDGEDGLDTRALSTRANVPGLHCGYTRAALCALNVGGVAAQCIWAAIDIGTDPAADGRPRTAGYAWGYRPRQGKKHEGKVLDNSHTLKKVDEAAIGIICLIVNRDASQVSLPPQASLPGLQPSTA